jgi:hypothetical protein
MALQSYAVPDPELTCYTDLGDSRSLFLPELEAFIESHPKVLRFAALTDLGHFDLSEHSRHVVRLEFRRDGQSDGFVFGREIVEFVMRLADTFATLRLPRAVLWRIQARRRWVLRRGELKRRSKKSNRRKKGFQKAGWKPRLCTRRGTVKRWSNSRRTWKQK